MTKRNLTLGSASGKLGSVVYMRRRGQQIARLLVPAPNDPRTLNQCMQRAAFANYVTQWRALRTFVDSSWAGVSRYGSRENGFGRHQRGFMPCIPSYYARNGQWIPSLGLLTYGSLPISFEYHWDENPNEEDTDLIDALWLTSTAGQRAPSSVEGLLTTFINAGTGIREGDIMHTLIYNWYSDWQQDGRFDEQRTFPTLHHSQVLLSRSDNSLLTEALPLFGFHTGVLPNGQICVGMSLDENVFPYQQGLYRRRVAVAVWFERPSAPRHQRFSRCRWGFDNSLIGFARLALPGTEFSEQIAITYQNV